MNEELSTVIRDNELTISSPISAILRCMVEAHKELSSNEYIYQDDAANTNIAVEEVESLIQILLDRGE